MRKGISPVIAVVLLIAISVIAAVGVWYWVAGLADKPAGADYTQTAFSVQECSIDNGEVLARNTG
ncbi:MAG: archaellin/type IV pilin N-terminal domain-containing protein [archaeon]